MIGVKNLDGMLGTDIFYNDGLLTAAAALPAAYGLPAAAALPAHSIAY